MIRQKTLFLGSPSAPAARCTRMASLRFLPVLLALPLMACASLPQPIAERSGEPLSVRERTQTATVNERVKVGEVEHKSSNGQTYAKSEVYANQSREVRYQVWNGFQGQERLTDDDFYRIANDKSAEEEVKRSRENGITMNRIGLGVLAAGIAGVVAGIAINASQSGSETPSMTGLYITSGAGVVAGVGAILTYVGLAKTKAEHPLQQERAETAAVRYNRTLGDTPGATTVTSASPVAR